MFNFEREAVRMQHALRKHVNQQPADSRSRIRKNDEKLKSKNKV